VSAGTQYAIVFSTPASACSNGEAAYVVAHGLGGSVYAGGSFDHSPNGGTDWLIDQFDGTFKTYVDGVLDQSQTTFDLIDRLLPISGVVWANTFTAGISGDLDQVGLDLRKDLSCIPDANLEVEIQTTSGGRPTGTVLAGSALPEISVPLIPSFVPIQFSPAAQVTAGTQYAIVISSSATPSCVGGAGPYNVAHTLADVYPDGSFVHSANGSASWLIDRFDGTFKTYVEGAPQLLGKLVIELANIRLSTSLTSKVNAAQNALGSGDAADACTALDDFGNEVNAQTGKKISLTGGGPAPR
jgi:hypothetical protein